MVPLARTLRATSGDTLLWPGTGDGEDRLHDTAEAFTGDDTGSEGEADSLELGWVALLPDDGGDGTDAHRQTVLGLWQDEGETGSGRVGDVSLVLGRAEPGSEDDEDGRDDGEDDGEDTSGRGDWEAVGRGDSDGDGSPGTGGWDTVLAGEGVHVENAWRGSGEEDEEADREEDGGGSTDELGEVLGDWLGTNQVTSLEITRQVGSLGSSTTSDHTREQVDSEGVVVEAGGRVGVLGVLAVGDTTNDELRGLCDGGDWVDVGDTSSQDTDEGEDEGEDDGEDRDADVDLEGDALDDAGDGDGDDGDRDGHVPGDLVPLWCRVDERLELAFDLLLALASADHVAGLENERSEAGSDGPPLNSEFDEGRDQHDEDTDPEEVVTGGGLGRGWVLWGHAVVASVGDVATLGGVDADGTAGCNHSGTDDGPGEDRSTVEGERGVRTGEDTGTNESRSELSVPALNRKKKKEDRVS